MSENLTIDLHIHTTDSDGSITLKDLFCEILEKKINIFSVTEHETMVNVNEVRAFAIENNLIYIPGVELTVGYNGRRHILAYGVDPNNKELQKVMKKNKVLLDADPYGDPNLHATPKEAIDAINSAGGVAVLAHPGARYYDSDFVKVVNDFVDLGIQGIECFHPDNNEKITKYCLNFCKEKDLIVTGGSDYHGDCVQSRKLNMMNISLCDLNLKTLINLKNEGVCDEI